MKENVIDACPFCAEPSDIEKNDVILIQFETIERYIYAAHRKCIEKIIGEKNVNRQQTQAN